MQERIYFIYEKTNQNYVDILRNKLNEEFDIVSNYKISFGDNIQETFEKNIVDCSIVIVIIDKHSYTRKFIDWEMHTALVNQKPILALMMSKDIDVLPARLMDNMESGYCTSQFFTENINDLNKWINNSIKNGNKNLINNTREKFAYNRTKLKTAKSSKNCIFLSHKKDDKNKTRNLATYIKQLGIDVYLDEYDKKLQASTIAKDSLGIVEAIEKGIVSATDLLCVLSDKTEKSWWVPFEIGMARAHGKNLGAVYLNKNSLNLPEYLLIIPKYSTEIEFENYIKAYITRNSFNNLELSYLENNRSLLTKIFS